MARILVVADEPGVRHALRAAAEACGDAAHGATAGAEALAALRTELFDVAIVDIALADMAGAALVRAMASADGGIAVIAMADAPSGSAALEALQAGAFAVLPKPPVRDSLCAALARVRERRLLRDEIRSLRERLGEGLVGRELIGVSPPMRQVRDAIARVAPGDVPVLVEGERGTGKDLVAATIHRLSARARGPLVPVDCRAIPDTLLESELFGVLRGSEAGPPGLFRRAHGGTLYLEIADLPSRVQAALLRVLSDGDARPVGSSTAVPVDVRVIVGTCEDLDAARDAARLRPDLHDRLAAARVRLVPLRERRDDIPALVHDLIRRLNVRFRRAVVGIAPEALAALAGQDFPGNVRDLEIAIEGAFARGARDAIALADLSGLARGPLGRAADARSVPRLADVERELIVQALAAHRGDKDAAAAALGISRRTIYRRLKAYAGGPERPDPA